MHLLFADDCVPVLTGQCVTLAGQPCIGMHPELSQELSMVDMAQALQDFDGDHASVSGLLLEFLGDRSACARRLAFCEGSSSRQLIAVLHDVANTLDAGWCRQAALAVRRFEDRLRHGTAAATAELVAEVQAIVGQAFDGVAAVVRHCPHCLSDYRA